MLNHPTTTLGTDEDVVELGIILIGPTAAGKSTVLTLLDDLGCYTIDVSDVAPEEATEDGGLRWQDQCMETLDEMPCSGVSAIEGLQTSEEVSWFADQVERHLVVRIDTHDEHARQKRFIDQRLDRDREVVSTDRIADLRQKFRQSEYDQLRESPEHHVRIMNDDSVTTLELWDRVSGLLSALTTKLDDRDPLDEPVQETSEAESETFEERIVRIIEEDKGLLDRLDD